MIANSAQLANLASQKGKSQWIVQEHVVLVNIAKLQALQITQFVWIVPWGIMIINAIIQKETILQMKQRVPF